MLRILKNCLKPMIKKTKGSNIQPNYTAII